tara:strand:+ start:234 stop:473 length:240 start_codon:yes stop_codon:yes gene_type:complete
MLRYAGSGLGGSVFACRLHAPPVLGCSPTDERNPSYDALEYYSMHEDGFEIGVQESGMGKYPAFFWATRDGIQGRDFTR